MKTLDALSQPVRDSLASMEHPAQAASTSTTEVCVRVLESLGDLVDCAEVLTSLWQ